MAIGEENSQNTNAFVKLKNRVRVYLKEGWRPVGGPKNQVKSDFF